MPRTAADLVAAERADSRPAAPVACAASGDANVAIAMRGTAGLGMAHIDGFIHNPRGALDYQLDGNRAPAGAIPDQSGAGAGRLVTVR